MPKPVKIRDLVAYGSLERSATDPNVQVVVDRAAIVTEVQGDGITIGVCIFYPAIVNLFRGVKYADNLSAGCWSWPAQASSSTDVVVTPVTEETATKLPPKSAGPASMLEEKL